MKKTFFLVTVTDTNGAADCGIVYAWDSIMASLAAGRLIPNGWNVESVRIATPEEVKIWDDLSDMVF